MSTRVRVTTFFAQFKIDFPLKRFSSFYNEKLLLFFGETKFPGFIENQRFAISRRDRVVTEIIPGVIDCDICWNLLFKAGGDSRFSKWRWATFSVHCQWQVNITIIYKNPALHKIYEYKFPREFAVISAIPPPIPIHLYSIESFIPVKHSIKAAPSQLRQFCCVPHCWFIKIKKCLVFFFNYTASHFEVLFGTTLQIHKS